MEHLAENRTVINKRLFREGMLRISRDNYGKAAKKSMLIFLGVWLLFVAVTLLGGGNILQTLGSLALVGLIGVWICVYLPRYNAGRLWKAQEARYGCTMERLTRFYPAHMTITGEGVEMDVSYGDIVEIKHSRHLVVLICQNNAGILLEKGGFSGMNEEEIMALIQGATHKE